MDMKKLQQVAEELSKKIPEGETKPIGEMDLNNVFQHTTQVVMDMMKNGELENILPGMELPTNNVSIDEIEEIEDDEDDEDEDDGDIICPKNNNLNLTYDLNVSLKELYKGKIKKIHVKRKVFKEGKLVKEKKKFSIPINPGTTDGEIIRFKGEADQAKGYQPGDIIIRICETDENTQFERLGNNLLLVKEKVMVCLYMTNQVKNKSMVIYLYNLI